MRNAPRTGPLRGHTLLAVFAHPDDESLSCGGTLARCADAGAKIVLLCATRGELGSVSDPALVGAQSLGRVREAELRAAARVLGVSDVQLLEHRDGGLPWGDPLLLQAEIRVAIRHYRPDVVITFGADGLYWHPDHIAVHACVTAAVKSLQPQAPVLYYVTIPSGVMEELAKATEAGVDAGQKSQLWGIPPEAFGYGAEAATLVIDVRAYTARKLAALRCHRTQVGPDSPIALVGEPAAERLLGMEHFHRAPFMSTSSQTFFDRLTQQELQA